MNKGPMFACTSLRDPYFIQMPQGSEILYRGNNIFEDVHLYVFFLNSYTKDGLTLRVVDSWSANNFFICL